MKYLRWFLAIICVFLLMSVRVFETQLFYDPLLSFFKSDFYNLDFPEFDVTKHLLSMALRYGINSILSLAIIYSIFNNKDYLKLSVFIYLIGFVVFFALYYYSIHTEFSLGFTAGFYIRRLVIQPVLLLLLIPVFWYINHKSIKS